MGKMRIGMRQAEFDSAKKLKQTAKSPSAT